MTAATAHRGRMVAWSVLLAVLAVTAAAPPASAEGPRVTGAGSTWSEIAVQQWRADVARFGLDINYQGSGSSAGRQFYVIGQVDFAVSEIPFQPEEEERLAGANRSFQYLPIVAGGTSLMYNLVDSSGQRVTDLQLSPPTIAGLFTGRITDWSDPAITADNGGRALQPLQVVPTIRSDGSGTSAQFTAYLANQTPQLWREFTAERGYDSGSTSFYPEFPGSVAQRGSDGVANYVANTSTGLGSITYVEAGYALQRGFPVASVLNASGNYTQPTARNVAVALTQATLNADRTQNLDAVYVHGDPATYPISSYSYMITQTAGFDSAKGEVLAKFILYFVCEGQQKAEVLGYSPLPPNLVQIAFDAVAAIPGAPPLPPLSACANPTIGGTGSTADVVASDPQQQQALQDAGAPAPVAGGNSGAAPVAGTTGSNAGGTAAAPAVAGGEPLPGVAPVPGDTVESAATGSFLVTGTGGTASAQASQAVLADRAAAIEALAEIADGSTLPYTLFAVGALLAILLPAVVGDLRQRRFRAVVVAVRPVDDR